ncbi:MAG: hypothetical protein ACJ746_00585 [Bryobacteraceae bacterium]
MGSSRRREAREIAGWIAESNKAIEGVTLGQVCAAGLVVLEVQCHQCPRKGRYRVTRLVDQHGAGMELLKLKDLLAVGCPKLGNASYFDRCGVYFPAMTSGVPRSITST